MQATISYKLSPEGQKAAIKAKLGGQADRKEIIEVPEEAIDLFDVTSTGTLVANLEQGAERRWAGDAWQPVTFDHLLTADQVIEFIRTRQDQRAEVLAAEKAEREARQAAEQAEQAKRAAKQAAARQAEIEQIRGWKNEGALSWFDLCPLYRDGKYVPGIRVSSTRSEFSTTDPDCAELIAEVVAILERQRDDKAAADAIESARQERLARIPVAPVVRAATIGTDGKITVTIPVSDQGDKWAKHVTSVDATKPNGMAFEGKWMDQGNKYALDPGEIIVTGSKWTTGSRRHAEYHKERRLWIVTPAGLLMLNGNAPSVAAEVLSQTPQERIVGAITRRLEVCSIQLAKLRELDPQEFADFAAVIVEREAAWTELRTSLESALAAAQAEPAITTIEAAAMSIVSAGYRALAAKHHPDQGGSVEVMALLNQARTALAELLKMAQGEVTA